MAPTGCSRLGRPAVALAEEVRGRLSHSLGKRVEELKTERLSKG